MDTLLSMHGFAQVIVLIIIFIFLLTMGFSTWIRLTYKKLNDDILDQENRKNRLFRDKMINNIVDDFNTAVNQNVEEINTVAIIEKNMNTSLKSVQLGERFIKKSVSMMIILGLLGTFYGLVISIEELVSLLSNEELISGIDSITSGLVNSITGMSVAFITSMFGIGASIFTNLLNIFFGLSDSKERLVVALEEYLDNNLMTSNTGLGPVDEEGNTALSLSFDKFNDTLATNLRAVSGEITQQLSNVTSDMVLTAESIKSSVVRFDHSLNQFSENIRDFTEFNHHLKSNIQRMSLGFDDFSSSINKQVDDLENGYKKIDQLNKHFENLNRRDG